MKKISISLLTLPLMLTLFSCENTPSKVKLIYGSLCDETATSITYEQYSEMVGDEQSFIIAMTPDCGCLGTFTIVLDAFVNENPHIIYTITNVEIGDNDSFGLPVYDQKPTFAIFDKGKIKYTQVYDEEYNTSVFLNQKTFTNYILENTIQPLVNYIDKDIMARDIETAKALNPDALIACMHWGIEYQSLPNKEQTSLADWLLSRGVTHVIGSHPPVVQPMELRTDTLSGQQNVVLYSLGNFISNMSARKTDGGLLFKLELTKDSIGTSVSNCGYSLIWTARPTLSKKKNYVLYPASIPTDSLSAEERNRLKIFINDTRELFRKHNHGINEYIF